MRIFKTRWFQRWARKEKISDATLVGVVEEMEKGLIDADLGGHVIKKRVAIQGGGKSGGMRVLIAYQINEKSFFVYAFAKNNRGNISKKELTALQAVASTFLSHDDETLQHLMSIEEIVEVHNDE
jgi:hypothetical protein